MHLPRPDTHMRKFANVCSCMYLCSAIVYVFTKTQMAIRDKINGGGIEVIYYRKQVLSNIPET